MASLLSKEISPQITIIGVGIKRPKGRRFGLSPEVAAAVPVAVALLLSLLQEA